MNQIGCVFPALSLALLVGVAAQAQVAGTDTFEVASVKLSPPITGNVIRMGMSGGPGSASPGQITATNVALKDLVQRAYNLKVYQLTAPEWMASARYDIVAKVPAGASKEQVSVMWQHLLQERFKLVVHSESKELPIYALVVAKGGPKFSEAAPDDPAKQSGTPGSGSAFSTTMTMSGGGGSAAIAVGGSPMRSTAAAGTSRMSGDKMQMSSLADSITRSVDRPVLDETGLTGKYKIKLEWQREDLSPTASESTAPTIFVALQEQLGLKLEPRKGNIQLLVVDHAEKEPVEN